jgi:predicted O-linked N-acetylglucosamine transferase (SPINDLY family)
MNIYPEAEQLLLQGNYQELANFYEQKIENDPDNIDNYWYLGLAYLLLEKEEEAQTTWFFPLGFASEENIEPWTGNLVNILETEAKRQESLENNHLAWLIRGHLREIAPDLINNLLHLVKLSIILDRFEPQFLEDWQIIKLLQEQKPVEVDWLEEVVDLIIKIPAFKVTDFINACFPYFKDQEKLIDKLVGAMIKMAFQNSQMNFAIDILKICQKFAPNNLSVLKMLWNINLHSHSFVEAEKYADLYYQNSHTLALKILGNYQLLYLNLYQSKWSETSSLIQKSKDLLDNLFSLNPNNLEPLENNTLISVAVPFLYLQDNLKENRYLQNNIAKIFQQNIWENVTYSSEHQNTSENKPKEIKSLSTNTKQPQKILRIGYIGHTFRTHSVGFLARWLYCYHNKEQFEIFTYMINQTEDKITDNWFKYNSKYSYNTPADVQVIAEQISKDKIDILVDLDSMTFDVTCHVMALKQAPIQVTWLGFDASGIPAIDYYIADPYVLPENAQEYYSEKIWRLPQTYLGIDGFEIGVPTLKKSDLNIPEDGIIYLCFQNGLKRHPDTLRLQFRIVKQVENSFYLIKGLGEDQAVQELFKTIATEEGVSLDRIRFLERDLTSEIHRANLQIADIVLDTYPYNGATTTLETLWLGIPIVTKVGQQWAARNSYAFMMNAGITEGIAWNDQEYIDWGIRLGKDEDLRAKIAWKLRQSKKTAPLWNAKQFTLEMEKAYRQMWEIYCQNN